MLQNKGLFTMIKEDTCGRVTSSSSSSSSDALGPVVCFHFGSNLKLMNPIDSWKDSLDGR
jgi:hypothetical protein